MSLDLLDILTWRAAKDWHIKPNGTILANNTKIYEDKIYGSYYIKHHNTNIVRVYDGGFSVNVSGYQTVTTARRVSAIAYANNWVLSSWKFHTKDNPWVLYKYAPGIQLNDDGTCIGYDGWPLAASSGKESTLKLGEWWVITYYSKTRMVTHRHKDKRLSVPVLNDKCSGCDKPMPQMVNDVVLFKNSGLANS